MKYRITEDWLEDIFGNLFDIILIIKVIPMSPKGKNE